MKNTHQIVSHFTPTEIKFHVSDVISHKVRITAWQQFHVGKVMNDEIGNSFVKNVREFMKGTGFKLVVYGRNPNRKDHNISRTCGNVKRNQATYLSLFVTMK